MLASYPSYEVVQKARELFSKLSQWAKIVDKHRIHEILLFGFFIALLAVSLDTLDIIPAFKY